MTRVRYLHILLLIAIGLIVYCASFSSPFLFDDKWFILDNVLVRDLSNFSSFSGTRFMGFFSFAMNYAVDGYVPFGYNLVNIAIHIINGVLVYILIYSLFRAPVLGRGSSPIAGSLPLIVALIFIVHPIETQPVNYITQRFATLATLFYLLSLVCYLSYRINSSAKGASRFIFYLVALLSAILAQKTKEIAFTLPFMILLFELAFFTNEEGLKKRFFLVAPFLLTALIIPLSLFWPEGGALEGGNHALSPAATLKTLQVEELKELSRYSYLITEFRVIVTYIRLMILPIKQNLLYDYPAYKSFITLPVITSFISLAVLFLASLFIFLRSIRKRDPLAMMVGFGMLWFFITLSIESSLIPIQHVIFEHRLYLPSIGFFLSLSALFLYVLQRISHPSRGRIPAYGWVIVAIIVTVLSVASFKRSAVWSDEVRLWKDVVYKSPNLFAAQNNLGLAYSRKNENKLAIKHFKEAIGLKPDLSAPYNNLGQLFSEMGNDKMAVRYFTEAVRLEGGNAEALNNLGNFYAEAGETGRAIEHYQKAIRLKPLNDAIYYNLAGLYLKTRDMDNAIKNYKEAIRLRPGAANYHFAMAFAFEQTGETSLAKDRYLKALRLNPDYAEAHYRLGEIYYGGGEFLKAIRSFKAALRINPSSDDTSFNLATAFLAANDLPNAKRYLLETVRINPGSADAYYKLGLIYLRVDKPGAAEEAFTRALLISPEFPGARDHLQRLRRE